MLFKLSNLNSNLVLTLGYLNPALNNSALFFKSHKVQAGPKWGLIKYFRSASPSVSDGEQ